MKVQFNKNIHDMSQCLPNPGFMSIKVQNVDFLKKPSIDNIFSLHLCSPNMLSSFKSKIGNVYCPVYILELLTSVYSVSDFSLLSFGSGFVSRNN